MHRRVARGFEKITKLIDELVATLKKEQEEDDAEKEWCEADLDKTEDTKKALESKAVLKQACNVAKDLHVDFLERALKGGKGC